MKGPLVAVATGIVAVMAIANLAQPIHSATAASTQADQARPNVLLIITDDQRRKAAYGYMPDWTKYIRNRGTEYNGAIATTPNCCPSRATIMTGLYTHNHHVWNNQFPMNFPHERSVQYYLHERGG